VTGLAQKGPVDCHIQYSGPASAGSGRLANWPGPAMEEHTT